MKKAIIIGATSGIGRELAMLLAENNYLVGITGRRVELLESLKREKPDSFLWRAFDVTDTKATIENLEALVDELGSITLPIMQFRGITILFLSRLNVKCRIPLMPETNG